MRRLVYGQSDRVARWVFDRLPHADGATAYQSIGLETESGELIAGAVFNNYNGFDISLTVVSVSGAHWAHLEWIVAIFSYVFDQLGCRRLSVQCASKNHASRSLIKRLGFVQEGFLREALPDDDVLIFGMTRLEYSQRFKNEHSKSSGTA